MNMLMPRGASLRPSSMWYLYFTMPWATFSARTILAASMQSPYSGLNGKRDISAHDLQAERYGNLQAENFRLGTFRQDVGDSNVSVRLAMQLERGRVSMSGTVLLRSHGAVSEYETYGRMSELVTSRNALALTATFLRGGTSSLLSRVRQVP